MVACTPCGPSPPSTFPPSRSCKPRSGAGVDGNGRCAAGHPPAQEHLIAELNHALQGKRSKKLTEDERQPAFEDLSIALAEVEVEKDKRAAKAGDGAGRPVPRRMIGNLPADLPRIGRVIGSGSRLCPCGGGVAIAARIDGATMATAQDRRESPGAAGHRSSAAAGHRDHSPETCLPDLHRRADPGSGAPMSDHGWVADRRCHRSWAGQQMCGPFVIASPEPDPGASQALICTGPCWRIGQAKAAFHLKPVVDRLVGHLKASGKPFMVETTAPVLEPDARQDRNRLSLAV